VGRIRFSAPLRELLRGTRAEPSVLRNAIENNGERAGREISRDRILSDQEIAEFWRASLRRVPKSIHAASARRQQP
jgi:hypothetical protein